MLVKLANALQSNIHQRTISSFSMGHANTQSRLVLVSSQVPGFPYYGKVLTGSGENIQSLDLKKDEVLVYPEVLQQFNLKMGDDLKIGAGSFRIRDIVSEDSGQVFDMGAVAPKVFLSEDGIDQAKILQRGSTAFYSIHFKLKTTPNLDTKNMINDFINDNSFRVSLPKDSSNQVGRVVDYLTDFLGLVGLVSFILSLVGIFYLFRSYVTKERKNLEFIKL